LLCQFDILSDFEGCLKIASPVPPKRSVPQKRSQHKK